MTVALLPAQPRRRQKRQGRAATWRVQMPHRVIAVSVGIGTRGAAFCSNPLSHIWLFHVHHIIKVITVKKNISSEPELLALPSRLTKRWEASLWLNGRQLYLGGFNTEEDAAHAYDIVALACKGLHVATNFPAASYRDELVSLHSLTQVPWRCVGLKLGTAFCLLVFEQQQKQHMCQLLCALQAGF